MKRIFAVLTLVGIAMTGVAQNIKAGLYNKHGEAVKLESESVVVNVTLRVKTEKFTPGVYARYAQKYLGQRATLSEYSSVELLSGTLSLDAAEKSPATIESQTYNSPLPINRLSAAAKTLEEQAKESADMIFSLRTHRIDLITGISGENVFGAGLESALEEIARIEKECLEMFYGRQIVKEELHTFQIAITPNKTEYVVCRFNDESGIVPSNDLSSKPIIIKVETAPHKEYPELKPAKEGSLFAKEYLIIPQSKCSLVGENILMDTLYFASPLYGKSVSAFRAK